MPAYPLITSQDLFTRVKDGEHIHILDCSFFMNSDEGNKYSAFENARLPRAHIFDIDKIADLKSPYPHMLPDAGIFSDFLQELGIESRDMVVIYDQHHIALAAARGWWMFRAFGHENVAILQGGLPAWRNAGYRILNGPAMPIIGRKKSKYKAKKQRGWVACEADILQAISTQSSATQIIDARAAGRFRGELPEPREGLRSGHIPGSINLPYSLFLDPQTGFLRTEDKLASIIYEKQIDREKTIISSCGSGVTACMLALAFAVLEYPPVQVFDGSWTQWGRPNGPPIATGP